MARSCRLAVRLPNAQERALDRGGNGKQAPVVAVPGDQHDTGRQFHRRHG